MPAFTNGDNVIAIAAQIRDEAIIPGVSVFTARKVWTPETFAELHAAYVENIDESAASFEDKLQGQLDGVSDDALVLFSELLLLHLLVLGNITARRKFELIRTPLEMLRHASVEIPADIMAAVEAGGVLHGGQGVNQHRWKAMTFLVEWGAALAGLAHEDRAAMFRDTESVDRLIYDLASFESQLMQRSLAYLFAPTANEPIISQKHLERITAHFAAHIPDDLRDTPMQRQASAIRKSIAAERDAPDWDFYHDRDEWMPPAASSSSPTQTPERADRNANEPKAEAETDDTTDMPVPVVFPSGTADDLLVPEPWLNAVAEALASKRQIILQGPPGTGKTYLARRLAKRATGSDDQVEIVQFHPAYTYEDFFEGFRPQPDAQGQASFVLRPGPLRRLADRAAEDPARPYFLIIDEINRGNLAKIFGELYFLLEYRTDRVRLMYSQERFALPDNLFIIGTMNTADRSIALVDSAMRRRFAFFTLSPDREPVQGVLRRWAHLDETRDQTLADLLDELNGRIGDPDRLVGPSYFMQEAAQDAPGLARVWETEVLPLLDETFYGDEDVTARFSLTRMRAAARERSDAESPETQGEARDS